jgi:hypothetical protein
MAKDFVIEIVAERTAKNAAFPDLLAEAEMHRKLARRLVALREKKSLPQTVVAARMGTSASVVSKLEALGVGARNCGRPAGARWIRLRIATLWRIRPVGLNRS